jgi:hypothetical protein
MNRTLKSALYITENNEIKSISYEDMKKEHRGTTVTLRPKPTETIKLIASRDNLLSIATDTKTYFYELYQGESGIGEEEKKEDTILSYHQVQK